MMLAQSTNDTGRYQIKPLYLFCCLQNLMVGDTLVKMTDIRRLGTTSEKQKLLLYVKISSIYFFNYG